MIKIFRIKSPGRHKVAVASGIIFIFFSAWATDGLIDGGYDTVDFGNLTNIFNWHLRMWDEMFELGKLFFLLPIVIYLIFYLIGYLFIKIFLLIVENWTVRYHKK
tara:strand:- start:87 stop:401 length:315 start_codon:yes stop_codon:yes gene_type:complete